MLRIILLITVVPVLLFAKPQQTRRLPSQDFKCPVIEDSTVHIQVEFPERDNEPFLIVKFAEGPAVRQRVDAFDPTVECRKLLYFPSRGLIILDMYNGASGTDILIKMRTLYVFSIANGKVILSAEFPLEKYRESAQPGVQLRPLPDETHVTYTEPKSVTVEETVQGKKKLVEKIEFTITDEMTKKTSHHSY